MDEVEGSLGEAAGKLYVAAQLQARGEGAHGRAGAATSSPAYEVGIDSLEWMSPETKAQAQGQARAVHGEDRAIPTSGATTPSSPSSATTCSATRMRARRVPVRRHGEPARQAGRPHALGNDAADGERVLQLDEQRDRLPGRDPPAARSSTSNADDAVNYGAIGAVIGHEIGHGFDDQGRKSDGEGNLRDWWTPADAQAFEARTTSSARSTTAINPIDEAAHQRRAHDGREHRRH